MDTLLAINRGTPVRDSFLAFDWPCLDDDKINEGVDTLRSGWMGAGPKALRFDQMFAEHVNNLHALAVNSPIATLHYRAAHTQPFYRDTFGYKHEDYPNEAEVGDNIMTIPLAPRRLARAVEDVITAVRKAWRAYQRL